MKNILMFLTCLLSLSSLQAQTLFISGGGSVTAQNTAVYIATGATVSTGATALTGATVSVSGNFATGQDALGISGTTSGTDGSISYSYNETTGVLTLTGSTTAANYQTTLRKITFTNSSATPNTSARVVTISLNSALPFTGTGHYYEFVTSNGISWPDANTAANGRNYFGLQGYLVTVMSAEENAFCAAKLVGDGWMGANAVSDGVTWIWATGPEAGTVFWNGVNYGSGVSGKYANWATNQPDGTPHTEDYVQFYASGGLGKWNNLPIDYDALIKGYVVEYGGMAGDPLPHISENVVVNFAPKISNLVVSGTGIKWYDAESGGNLLPVTTVLVNGTVYYATQTVNGVESTNRLAITANVPSVASPVTGTHTPSLTQVVWNWNTVSGATDYKWSATNLYNSATDMGNVLTRTETGLTCNTAYVRYVWAYNASGCVSVVTTLQQTTSSCVATTSTFSYTGGQQTFTVPSGVTSITIEAWGAQGWSGTNSGGQGGYAKGNLAVTQDQTIYVYVGGQGTVATGTNNPSGAGWNGGGQGQSSGGAFAGGGGGASDVRFGGNALTDRVIVAGGGGGSTNNSSCNGGNGGGLSGDKGGGVYTGGNGGTSSAGGSFGGSLGQGGNALVSYTPWNGGGGGGYYGGGTSDAHGSGGGGSSYIGTLTNASTTTGGKTGDGQVKITY